MLPKTNIPPANFDITIWQIGQAAEYSNGRDDLQGEEGGNVTIDMFVHVPAE